MARYAYPGPVGRVECGGGPLVVVPVEVLTRWEGVDSEGPESDYDRACAVVGRTGLLTVGPSHALVRGDGPSSTTFLPKQGVFVRWVAAESEVELLGGVEAAWEDVAWEDGQVWEVPGAGRALRLRLARPEVEPDNHTRGAAASGPDRGDHRARLRTLAAANGPLPARASARLVEHPEPHVRGAVAAHVTDEPPGRFSRLLIHCRAAGRRTWRRSRPPRPACRSARAPGRKTRTCSSATR
ncbi:Imm21 family immunity protein [Streptomyces virginiae]|uniref:Imm21 family immunity protein n=1 Tax=Streptomyces virginiae TaxID=1961 RepID=UPI003864ACC5